MVDACAVIGYVTAHFLNSVGIESVFAGVPWCIGAVHLVPFPGTGPGSTNQPCMFSHPLQDFSASKVPVVI